MNDWDGDNLLHLAARWGSCLCIELLLVEYKFLVNGLNVRKDTALHIATANGHQETIGVLLKHKADQANPNKRKETALHIAAKTQLISVMQLLKNRNCDVDAQDCDGQTPLHVSVNSKEKGGSACILFLSKMKADLNIRDKQGMSALHLAAVGRRYNRVRHLIKEGADLCLKNDQGKSAIYFVMKYTPSCIQTIEEKLDSGIHINWTSDAVNDDTGQSQFSSTVKIDFNQVIPPSCKNKLSSGSDVRMLHELLEIYYHDTGCVEKVLMHPLSLCFLHFKWQQISFIYYIILISHVFFCIIYSGYVLLLYTNTFCTKPVHTHTHPFDVNNCTILKEELQDGLVNRDQLHTNGTFIYVYETLVNGTLVSRCFVYGTFVNETFVNGTLSAISCFNNLNNFHSIIGTWSLLLIFIICYIISQSTKFLHLGKK
jgi:hypothetical protein